MLCAREAKIDVAVYIDLILPSGGVVDAMYSDQNGENLSMM